MPFPSQASCRTHTSPYHFGTTTNRDPETCLNSKKEEGVKANTEQNQAWTSFSKVNDTQMGPNYIGGGGNDIYTHVTALLG